MGYAVTNSRMFLARISAEMEKGKTMDKCCREMTFEEEAEFYEKEARAEFAKETGGGDCSVANGILRRGMRIIRKARQEIARRAVVHGRWSMEKYPFTLCSVCGLKRDCEYDFGWNYCPNCGAKMDGDGNV